MKKIIIATLLGLFLVCRLKAQTSTTVPIYKEEMLVMKVYVNYGGVSTPYLTISDGISPTFCYQLLHEPYTMKNEKENSNVYTIANIMNQLKKQDYKLVNSSTLSPGSEGSSMIYYIFQKE